MSGITNIPVVSIVGYSGSGKTTLIEKLIVELRKRGLRVAVIKHDAHEFDIDHEGKDSWRYAKAGAEIAAIVSPNRMAMVENREVPAGAIPERITGVDIILTEGYKTGPWPKIAIRREATRKPLPIKAETCLAIVSDVAESTETPRFDLDDASGLADYLVNYQKTFQEGNE